jgi:chromatin segregation and condensation protein Rec8/ScpA/Scc1 (kleisin family)
VDESRSKRDSNGQSADDNGKSIFFSTTIQHLYRNYQVPSELFVLTCSLIGSFKLLQSIRWTKEGMPEQSSTVSTLCAAVLRGLCCYLACYVAVDVLSLTYLVSRDWSKYDANYTREVMVEINDSDQVANVSGLTDLNKMDDLVQDIKTLPQRRTTVDKASSVFKEYKETLSKWKSPKEDDSFRLRDGSQSINRLKFDNLLQQSSLFNMTDEELTSLFAFSVSELQGLFRDKKQLRWSSVHNILYPKVPFPVKEKLSKDKLHDIICKLPKVALEAVDEDDDDDDDAAGLAQDDEEEEQIKLLAQYAQEEDLEAYYVTAESLLDHLQTEPKEKCKSFSNIQSALSNGTKSLEQGFSEANSIIESAVEEENEKTETLVLEALDDDDENSCEGATHKVDIDALLDAGLNALGRRQDMRASLLDVLKEVDPDSAETLILDADFRTEPYKPPFKSLQVIRLRALIDSPLLRHVATSVDYVLDIMGGYYDPLDQQIDRLTERLVDPADHNSSSLGRVFVTQLWHWTGQWVIPIPTSLRQVLGKYQWGRNLLAHLL